MTITSDLASFYDLEAKKYHQTRKKYWSDADSILEALQKVKKKKLKIIELGCGGGRGISLLTAHYDENFSYVGVDISQNLLTLAKKDNPDQEFVCSDMATYLASLNQESIDIALAFASFQHLPNEKERLAVLKNIYRALNYGGIVVFTNWAISKRLLKKYWKAFLIALCKYLFSFGKYSWRNIYIPWKSKGVIHYRYYHFFGLEELKKLAEQAGFMIEELHFLDKKGNLTENWQLANNSFFVGRKVVMWE